MKAIPPQHIYITCEPIREPVHLRDHDTKAVLLNIDSLWLCANISTTVDSCF